VRKETGNGIVRSCADGTHVARLDFNAKFRDEKRKVDAVATAVGLSDGALEHFEKRFVGDGLDSALERKEREAPPRKIAFGGEFETQLVKLACLVAPDGRSRWTVRLLGDKLTEPKIVDSVSTMTVHNTLKNELKPRLCRRRKSSPETEATISETLEFTMY